jgi:Transposase DDE domain
VEALFAELKNQIGLCRLRLRRLKFVRQQFFLAAAAQNIKRLVRFLIDNIGPASHRLAERPEEKLGGGPRSREDITLTGLFQHPHLIATITHRVVVGYFGSSSNRAGFGCFAYSSSLLKSSRPHSVGGLESHKAALIDAPSTDPRQSVLLKQRPIP